MSSFPSVCAFDDFGGALVNYGEIVDPTTDRDASDINAAFASVAALSHVSDRCMVRYVSAATTGAIGDPASNVHDAAWGSDPSVKPTIARSADGIFTATWPTTVTDQEGNTYTLNLRGGHGQAEGATPYHVQVRASAANILTINVCDMAGAASNAVGATIMVKGF
jgi:hypothetical protein